jgi:hypothetical protein
MIMKPQTRNSSYLYDPLELLVKPTLVLAMNRDMTPKTTAADIVFHVAMLSAKFGAVGEECQE